MTNPARSWLRMTRLCSASAAKDSARVAVSTDVIVGFPGETEADFETTERFLREARYDFAYLFKYSAREGTRAWKTDETVDEGEKGRRLERLIALQESISLERHRERMVYMTKFSSPMGDAPWERGTGRRWLMQAVEGSLRRLRTDAIDVTDGDRIFSSSRTGNSAASRQKS